MEKRVRLVFGFVLLIFLVGLYIARRVEEPYPALLFPPFAGIPNTNRL